jgi:hypothetical protein
VATFRTYATFRAFSESLDPDEVSRALGIEPTKCFRAGDERKPNRPYAPYRSGGWLLSTEAFESRDIREHVDRLLDRLEPSAPALARLVEEGARCSVFCFWSSDNGQGGPQLDPTQMARLAALNLPILFDVYTAARVSAFRFPSDVGDATAGDPVDP